LQAAAAHGLHGLQAAAAHGLHGLQAETFLAAHGLQGLQADACVAAQGLQAPQAGFLAAQGLAAHVAAVGVATLTESKNDAAPTPPRASGMAAAVDRSFVLSVAMKSSSTHRFGTSPNNANTKVIWMGPISRLLEVSVTL